MISIFLLNISFAIPQKLEDLIIRKKEFQIDTIISYNNISFSDLAENQVISEDVLYYVLNLRYDITDRIELFLFSSFNSTFVKKINHKKIKVERGDFHNLGPTGTGFSFLLKKEGRLPGFSVSLSTNVYDRLRLGGKEKGVWFDSYSFYLSTFYTIDPVVLLITMMYRLNTGVDFDNKRLDYGDTFFISPQFYFLANPFVSINVGFRYIYQGKDKLDKDIIMVERSMVGFLLGLNYEVKRGIIFSIDGEFRQRADFTHNIINARLTFRF